jgi:hypothetical protein
MTRRKIPDALAARIRQQARFRCGYCLRCESIMGLRMEFEHLTPLAAGGATTEENLWLSCRVCNGFKLAQTEASDPETGLIAPLFNPRRQTWSEHFRWSHDGAQIIGLTLTGRATVVALKLNDPLAVTARRAWVSVGWWPPVD